MLENKKCKIASQQRTHACMEACIYACHSTEKYCSYSLIPRSFMQLAIASYILVTGDYERPAYNL